MKLEGKKGLSKIIQIVLWIGIIIGIITLIALPFILLHLNKHLDIFVLLIYPCGILFIIMAYYFIEMFKSIELDNAFNHKNTIKLKKSMNICFLISLLTAIDFLITLFVYNYYTLHLKIALVFISLLFFSVAIALYIVSELYKKAIEYKEENDLTI